MTEDLKLDPITNLPTLPHDYRWRVVKDHESSWGFIDPGYTVLLERSVIETKRIPVSVTWWKRPFKRTSRHEEEMVLVWRLVDSAYIARPALDKNGDPKKNAWAGPVLEPEKVLTPELVLEFATALYKKWTAYKAEKARVRDGERLLGEYPPKSL